MRKSLVAFVSIAALLMGVQLAFGEDAPGGRAQQRHDNEEIIVKLKLHGQEEMKALHLNNKDDRQFFIEHLNDLEEAERVDTPDLFALKRWDLGIWSIVIFVLLFLGLSKFAWKPMVTGLQKREENIRSSLEQAERTRKEAMQLQSDLDAKTKDAGAEIAKRMEEARREAQGLKDKFLTDAKAEIQAERDRLRREIDTAKDQALTEIWEKSVTLAALMSTKALRRSMTEQDHRRLLDESLAELKEAELGSGKRNA
jgi:F-type H+-transporting ATPase subunit b